MKVVLAYSGGLDTSVILAWLKERYDAEVIAYTADVGQGEEVAVAEEKALATGAAQAVVDDLRHEFVTGAVFPAVRGAAVYENGYLLGTALARPIIARGLAATAVSHGAAAVAHGATGKGNDQVRFELSIAALEPGLRVIAPWREWELTGRRDLIAYAESHGIPIPVTREAPYSMDANLFHISYEGGLLEDPWQRPPEDMFRMTTDPGKAPENGAEVVIGFENGTPVTVDGQQLQPVDLLALLNELAGAHGVGRIDIVENRFVGIKSRGVYETPGGTVLHAAHRALEGITLDREVLHLREDLSRRYARMIYNGFWFTPERELLQQTLDAVSGPVSGEVRLELHKGAVRVNGRRSPNSLYDEAMATFEADEVYSQADAGGFITLNALRLRGRQ
ncbi:MAG: argininosuccinate synthase [Acidimicrobiia bacterium]